MNARAVWLALMIACGADSKGTAVGNPGIVQIVVDSVPEDVTLTAALLDVADITLISCEKEVLILPIDREIDVLTRDVSMIPAGEWCRTTVTPGPRGLQLSLERREQTFDQDVDVEPLTTDGRYTIDGNELIVRLSLTDPMVVPTSSGTTLATAPDIVTPALSVAPANGGLEQAVAVSPDDTLEGCSTNARLPSTAWFSWLARR